MNVNCACFRTLRTAPREPPVMRKLHYACEQTVNLKAFPIHLLLQNRSKVGTEQSIPKVCVLRNLWQSAKKDGSVDESRKMTKGKHTYSIIRVVRTRAGPL